MRATAPFRESPFKHYRFSAVAGVLVAILVALLPLTDFGERVELRTHDLRFALRGPRPSTARIVVVGARRSTLAAWPEPTLFWGTRYAAVIASAHRNEARAIGLDFVPAVSVDDYLQAAGASTAVHPDADLAGAIQAAGGHVVLSEVLDVSGETPVAPIPRLAFLPDVGRRIGFINFPASADNIARMYDVSVRGRSVGGPDDGAVGGDTRWSLGALLAARPSPGGAPPRLPGGRNSFYINYTGGTFPMIPAERMASNDLSAAEREQARGAVVLVGENYPGATDNHIGPNGRVYDGVVIHAEAIASLLDGRMLGRGTPARESLITLAAGLSVAALTWFLSGRRGLIAVVTLAAAICGGVWLAFVRADFLLPLAAPGIAAAVVWLTVRSVRSVEEGFRRLRIEATFGRHVAPAVRDHLLAVAANDELGGARCEVTVLFFDLRGSTKYAAERGPAEMVSELNELFAGVVPVIEANNGLVNRFLGDGFLAIFGWPESPPEGHAQAAMNAAVGMLAAMPVVNASRAARQLTPWRIGCAIHTGEVLCGNVGVRSRTEFTFMGSTINRAAHMERLNKEMGTQVVFSEATLSGLTAVPPGLNDTRSDEFGMRVYGMG